MPESAISGWLEDPPALGTKVSGEHLSVFLRWEAVKAMALGEQQAVGAGLTEAHMTCGPVIVVIK
jgi:hypothetical protein